MRRIVLASAVAALLSAFPAGASDFAIFGSYWQTEDFDDTPGGGVKLGLGDGPFRFELRGGYYPDLTEDFDAVFDTDDEFDDDFELSAIPLEAGVTFNFGGDSTVNPYLGGGASYFLLDSDFGEIDDEVGYYLTGGLNIGGGGDGGVGFFAEAVYRSIEGSVRFDPEDFDDIDDVDFEDEFDLDLGGFAANVGIVFRF